MNAAAPRQAISPYARRLARERGVRLAEVTGSGPGGRVIAFDILSLPAANARNAPVTAATPAPEPATATAAVPATLAALGATAQLDGLNELLASVAAAGGNVTREVAILRAIALSVATHPADGSVPDTISLETDAGGIVLAGIGPLSLGAIGARREAATPTDAPTADLSVRFSAAPGVRRLFLPLKPGIPMRLALSISKDGSQVDCLLVHDSDAVPTDRAEAILGSLTDGLDAPLSLFV